MKSKKRNDTNKLNHKTERDRLREGMYGCGGRKMGGRDSLGV